MRTYHFPLAAFLALAMALPMYAAEKPRTAQGTQNQPKKVWTNDDMDQLRARGLISIVGPEFSEPAVQPAVNPVEPTYPAYDSRLSDPSWYADTAAKLQEELDKRQALLQQEQTAIALAPDRITQHGVAMDKPSYGVTPQEALAVLEAQVGEVQSALDQLSDLARQNNIPPGVLRS